MCRGRSIARSAACPRRRQSIVKPFLLLGKYLLAGDLFGSIFSINPGESPPETVDGKIDVAFIINTFTAIKDWMNQHYTLISLSLIPAHALALRLTFARAGQVNFPEWLVITTFLTAQSFVIMLLMMPVKHWYPLVQPIATLAAVVYGVASLVQYFAGWMPAWKVALRAILGYVVYMLVTFFVTVIFSMVVVFMAMR